MIDPRTTPFLVGLSFGAALYISTFAVPESFAQASLAACTRTANAPLVIAKAAYVYDVQSGRSLFEKAGSAQLPLASLTKLMTVDTALEVLGTDAVLTIHEALEQEGESGFVKGERWKAGALAHFTLIESSNDGAHALGLATEKTLGLEKGGFVDAMNRRARVLGLSQTYFLNDTGLDISPTTAGAYGSARDMALLVTALGSSSPTVVERSTVPMWDFVSVSGKRHTAKNTALLATLYPATVVSKTGFTDLAGGNIVLLFEPIPGRPVAISILGSTRDGREEDAEALAEFAEGEIRRLASCTTTW